MPLKRLPQCLRAPLRFAPVAGEHELRMLATLFLNDLIASALRKPECLLPWLLSASTYAAPAVRFTEEDFAKLRALQVTARRFRECHYKHKGSVLWQAGGNDLACRKTRLPTSVRHAICSRNQTVAGGASSGLHALRSGVDLSGASFKVEKSAN